MILPTPAAAGAFLLKNWLPVALAIALLVQTVRIEGFGVWPLKIPGLQDKYDAAIGKLVEARAELQRISDKRNEQGETTKGNIDKAETIRDKADDKAREIEDAPTAPDCKTPDAILNADL